MDVEFAGAHGTVLFVCSPGSGIRLARSLDRGASWIPAELLLPDTRLDWAGVEISPSGTAILVYRHLDQEAGRAEIRSLRSTDHGETWGMPFVVAPYDRIVGQTVRKPRLATDGDGVWIAAVIRDEPPEGETNSARTFLVRSSDDGASWGEMTSIPLREGGAYAGWGPTSIAANGSNWLIVCADATLTELHGTDYDLVAFRSSDRGLTWSGPSLVNSYGVDDDIVDFGFAIASGGKGVWIASWIREDASGLPVFSRSDNGGSTWSDVLPLDSTPGISMIYGSIASDGVGTLIVPWASVQTPVPGGPGEAPVYLPKGAISRDGGITWTEPFPLAPDASTEDVGKGRFIWNDEWMPEAMYAGGDAWIAWWYPYPYDNYRLTTTRSVNLDATYVIQEEFGHPDPNDMFWFGFEAGVDAESTATGLCLVAPAEGGGSAVWSGPGKWLKTVDGTLLRIAFETTTDAKSSDSIPLWDLGYDNTLPLHPPSFANGALGGQFLFLDQAGGASGIGRAQGRSQFEAWIAPLPFLTPQWRGEIDGIDGAFTPMNDVWNDIHINFRVMDFDAAGYGAQFDSGSVCLERLRVDRYDYSSLETEPLWSPPISEATHAPQTYPQVLEPGLAWIENGEVRYSLPPEPFPPTGATGLYTRKTLVPYDPLQPDWNARLFPVPWESDTLYMGEMDMRAIGTDSGPDVIAMHFDVPTWEQIVSHVCIRDTPTSPLPSEIAGGPQPYVGFFYSHNVTAVDPAVIPNAARFRMLGDFMSSFDVGPASGLPSPDFAVSRMAISRVVTPHRDRDRASAPD